MYQNEKTCRLCLLDVSVIIPIFSTKNVAETSSIQMKIMELANVQVYAGDGLPSSVCENCHKLLDSYHAFKTQIEKSDVILRHQLSTSQTDPLSIDSKLEESVNTHGEFVKAETLVIKDEVIDEEHVERIMQPSSSRSPSSHLTDAIVNDDDRDNDDDSDNDNDPGGGDMDVDEEEETDPLASDAVELPTPSAVNEVNAVVKSVANPVTVTRSIVSTTKTIPLVTSSPIVANQPTNLLLVAAPLILKSPNQVVNSSSATATSFVALPTNVSSTFVTVPSSAIKAPIQTPSATVTSKTIKKKTVKKAPQKAQPTEIKDEPKPSTSTADSAETGESSASTSGEQPQVNECLTETIGSQENDSKCTSVNEECINGKDYFCKLCGSFFRTFATYKKHLSKDHKNNTCNLCDKSFTRHKNLLRHVLSIHSNRSYRCEVCGKFFKSRQYVKLHVELLHIGVKSKFECDLCDKKFRTLHVLKKHKNSVHTYDEKTCGICSKLFKNEITLKNHVRSVHMSDNVRVASICEVCGKSTMNITSHMNYNHLDNTNVTCDICGKTYRNKACLSFHINRTHSLREREREHTCEMCGASFKMKKMLKMHYVTHSDARNYKCNICDKTFKLKSVCKTHQRVHTDVQPYKCDKCDESFKWKQTFEKHSRKCHGNLEVDKKKK